MTSLVILGLGPHPDEAGAPVSGPTIRLRQFVQPLVASGADVRVVMLEERARDAPVIPGVERVAVLDPEVIQRPAAVRRALKVRRVDAVLGVGSLMPAVAGVRLAGLLDVPCWVDFFGDPLAEWHAECSWQAGSAPDRVRKDQVWKFVRECLLGGDAYSVVSVPQAHALLGQLLLAGRIDGAEDLHKRISPIPVAAPETWGEPLEPGAAYPRALAGRGLPEGVPFVLVAGSWTTWMAAGEMGSVLARVLRLRADVHAVVRGGTLDGPHGPVARAFFDALGPEGFPGRVHDLSRDACAEQELAAHAAAVLLLDRDVPEAVLGARNRLLALTRGGARAVATPLSQTARELEALDLARLVPVGDLEQAARVLAEEINASNSQRAARRETSAALLRRQSYAHTLRPVFDWCDAPARWPRRPVQGLVDAWAGFPAEPRRLFSKR